MVTALWLSLGAMCAAWAALVLWMRHEARAVEIETVDLRGRDQGNGARVALIADVHVKLLRVKAATAARLVAGTRPDAVVLAGDYIDNGKDITAFVAWLGAIVEALGGVGEKSDAREKGDARAGTPPFYMCLGNHDMRAFERHPQARKQFMGSMRAIGVRVLDEASHAFECRGKLYAVTGYRDLYSRRARADGRAALVGAQIGASYRVGLAHNPDFALDVARMRPREKPDLLLCGHFHGGQIWTPFKLEFMLLRKEKLCRMGVRRGLHQICAASAACGAQGGSNGGTQGVTQSVAQGVTQGGAHNERQLVYISRGIGCVLFPLRFLSKPEITLLLLP